MKTRRVEVDWVPPSFGECPAAAGQALLLAFFLCALPAPGFHWDSTGGRIPLSEAGAAYDCYRIVDADQSGDALAAWWEETQLGTGNTLFSGLQASYHTGGGTWTRVGEITIPAGTLYRNVAKDSDVSLNDSKEFIMVGVEYRYNASLTVTNNRILALLGPSASAQIHTVTTRAGKTNVVGYQPFEFKCALSPNGDALVAWEDVDANRVLARVYRAGNWQAETVLDVTDVRSLGVAADSTGNFIVVWNPDEVGAELKKIYARRYVAGSWLPRELVGQAEGATSDTFPRAGMPTNGQAIVAWWHSFPSYNGIVARRFDGSSWLPRETLDAGSAPGNALGPPDIAVQRDGKAMVLFQQGNAQSGTIYVNRLAGGAWSGPQEVGCGNLGAKFSVDMDGHGNAVAAFQVGSSYKWHAFQEGLGWLGCSAQAYNSQSSSPNIPLLEERDKKIVLTPHEVIGVWENVASGPAAYTVNANHGLKDVRINGNATETASTIVDLHVKLPFNSICGGTSPFQFQEMRFSNDGTAWSAWEPAPTSAPYVAVKTGWNLANPLYGGTATPGLKRAFVQFTNINCHSLVTHDEILLSGPNYLDIGLRAFDGTENIRLACENPGAGGTPISPLRVADKTGVVCGVVLTETNDASASRILIQTSGGLKAVRKLP